MKREQKEIFIKNLKTILSENSLVLVFHYRGMSMTDMTDLRVKSFNPKYVLVHDAVRPFFSMNLLKRVLENLEG